MTDLTKIEKPFGLLTPEEQKALVEWPHGLIVFVGSGWVDRAHSFLPFLDYSKVYRAKPAPVTKPSVDWNVFTDDVICITRDKVGGASWGEVPRYQESSGGWIGGGALNVNMDHVASYSPGTCPDSEAIAYRPGYEPEGRE